MTFQKPKEQSLYEMQEEVLKFWEENKIFEKSVENRSIDDVYSFYDGPPFITGSPHYGTLLPSIAKDIIPRYQTMRGKRVRRVWGWDCHGLPAENKVEKQLGLKSKKDIETLGVDKFVAACREYVTTVSADWKWYIDHIGRWADMKNAYKTMDLSFMESVIWAFKELYDKGLIYRGMRSSLYCTRCATPLSKFEITMDDGFYRDVTDPTVTVKFKLKNDDRYVLAWTTTPWTLPGNAALAVDEKEMYVEVEVKGEKLVLAKKTLAHIEDLAPKVVREFLGSELVGLAYEPLYTFIPAGPNDHKIYAANFVTMEDGTGVVHVAPAFGEVDFDLGKEKGLTAFLTLDEEGKMSREVTPFSEIYLKKADPLITEDLKSRNLLLKSGTITHSYPFCYRCETLLIYKAQDAWYLSISKLRDQMIAENEKINWVPEHFKKGRFEHNLANAPDWCLSRSRYFASPIPVWECEECNEIRVFGSLKELEDASGQKITDLHRPMIDEVTVPCAKCGKTMQRVREVLDCWFESGGMPYGERHYPFENKEEFERGFPADFIIEYTGQLRGWFYYLHVLGVGLKQSHVFKNVIVSGNLMGNDGRKMSKSLGNYPDPKEVLEKYGGETLRLYFMSNPIMQGEDMAVKEEDISEYYRKVMMILWNSYTYFITYANVHEFTPLLHYPGSTNVLDRWIRARVEELAMEIEDGLDTYDYPRAVRAIRPFVEDLSTWYIRRSRDRFQSGDREALQTLNCALWRFIHVTAPILPFTTETIYRAMILEKDAPLSIHLRDWVSSDRGVVEGSRELFRKMQIVREAASKGNAVRKESQIPVRQPLPGVVFATASSLVLDDSLIALVKEELNVKQVSFKYDPSVKEGVVVEKFDTTLTPELKREGLLREVSRALQDARKKLGYSVGEEASLAYFTDDAELVKIFSEELEMLKKDARLAVLERSNSENGLTEVLIKRLFVGKLK